MSAVIKRLRIERFRAFDDLTWYPGTALNVLLGGGDTGKTTILEAIGLLLNPSNYFPLSSFDYWRRNVEAGFSIEGVFSFAQNPAINQQQTMLWPWRWDGEEAFPPPDDLADEEDGAKTVYVLRVNGTPELDLEFEVLQPNGSTTSLPVSLRRSIGLVNLPADGRNDRDLRLVRGSALDRLLGDPVLRARLEFELANDQLAGHLRDEAHHSFEDLEERFQESSLPHGLGLGLTGGPGLSISALVGLMASPGDCTLPLASWGAGTRRLAALSIAASLQGEGPITTVDELERGLEAYRQRSLVNSLQTSGRQVFLTTHSPVVLGAASGTAEAWYLDSNGNLGKLGGPHLSRLRRKDPEAFFSRLTIVCEGVTEVGFAESLLTFQNIGDLERQGIHLADCEGHAEALGVLKELSTSGLAFAGLVDNEGTDPGRWRAVKKHLGDLLLQWPCSSLEEEVISRVKHDRLRELIEDPKGEKTGKRLRTLADRLEIQSREWGDIVDAAGDDLRIFIIQATLGTIPKKFPETTKPRKKELKSHGRDWFKSKAGGAELFAKLRTLELWEDFEPMVLPFVDAIERTIRQGPGPSSDQ